MKRRPRAASDSSGDHLTRSSSRRRGAPCTAKTRYRIVVLGAAEVGKTCVVSRMLDESFLLEHRATVEDLHSGHRFEFDGRPVTLDILDTSGTDEFPAMRRLSIATGDAFILVYDVSDPGSFRAVERFRRQIADEKAAEERIPAVVVGNKTDLTAGTGEDSGSQRRRAVERATAETTAAIDWGYGYVEVSAKDDRNIAGIFRELLAQINVRTEDEDEGESGGGRDGRSAAGPPGVSARDASKTRHSSLKDQCHQRKGFGVKRNSCRVS